MWLNAGSVLAPLTVTMMTRTTNRPDPERGPDGESLVLPLSFASSSEVLMGSDDFAIVELERIAMVEGTAAGAARYEEQLEYGALLVTVGKFNDSKGGAGMNDPSEANDPSRP